MQKSRAYAETVSDRNRILQSLETTEEELKEMSSQVATLSSQVVAAREAMGAVGRVAALEEEVRLGAGGIFFFFFFFFFFFSQRTLTPLFCFVALPA